MPAPESLPGGLLDRLAAAGTDELSPVRSACARGAYVEAVAKAGAITSNTAAATTWSWFAWHGSRMALHDGTARQWLDTGSDFPSPPAPRGIDAEADIVRVLTDVRNTRASASPHFHSLTGGFAPALLYDALNSIDACRATAEGRPDLLGHLDLLAADLVARAGDAPRAEELSRSAVRWLTAADDRRGLAAAALETADRLAAPLGSPLSWNCVLPVLGSTFDVGVSDTITAVEFVISAAGAAAAELAYQEASARYAEVDDPVGLAAVALRRAYLAVAGGRPGIAVELCQQARAVFEAAHRPLDSTVAAVHEALAAIADDQMPDDVADLVADTGRAVTGPASSHGFGLLCMRMGRHWAGKGQQPEQAALAFALADRLWLRLGETKLRVRALAGVAEASSAAGDFTGARVAVLDALDADPGPLAEPASPGDDRRAGRIELAARLYNLEHQAMDVDGMSAAAHILRDTVEPLRARLAEFTGVELVNAAFLVALASVPAPGAVELVYRARAARDEADDERADALAAEARAALQDEPHERNLLGEALLRVFDGDDAGASDLLERDVQQQLSVPTPISFSQVLSRQQLRDHELLQVRQLHVRGLIGQLNVGNATRARGHYNALIAAAEPWWSGVLPAWEARVQEGLLHEQEGGFATAAAAFNAAIQDVEVVRARLRRDELKRSFFAGKEVRNAFVGAVRVALRMGDDVAAFGYAERGRARALLDLMMANAGIEHAGLPDDLVSRWRKADASVALAERRLARADQPDVPLLRHRRDQALDDLRLVETDLRRTNPRFWSMVNPQAEVAGLADVAAALPAGAAVIQYVFSPHDLLAWAITADGMVARHLSEGEHRIQALVHRMVENCAHGGDHERPAALLADQLLEPLRSTIDASGSLYIVPSGPMMRLPFGVLPWNGATLGDHVPISILPTAGALLPARSRPDGNGRALVVGDPARMVFRDEPLAPLPGTRLEAAGVGRCLPDATVLIGEQATVDRAKELMLGCSVVHLATHGVLDPDAPLGSAIMLADGGQLTVAELAGERLSADLVVLSACHTGQGDVLRGDELLGLGRALFVAGARSAVVSLWAVDDLSAALLMTEFHRRRAAGESDSQALRGASRYLRTLDDEHARAMSEELRAGGPVLMTGPSRAPRNLAAWPPLSAPYSHPYHWAPFVLISGR